MATRCRSPPDSSPGRWRDALRQADGFERLPRRRRRSRGFRPAKTIGSSTFCNAVCDAIRWNDWKIMPTVVER